MFRNISNKNKYLEPQTLFTACVELSVDASSFISDNEVHIITHHYIM